MLLPSHGEMPRGIHVHIYAYLEIRFLTHTFLALRFGQNILLEWVFQLDSHERTDLINMVR